MCLLGLVIMLVSSARAVPLAASKCHFKLSKHRRPTEFLVYCNSKIAESGRNGNLDEAESIFERIPFKSVVSWTALLTAYAQNGELLKARKVFDEMPERNTATWNAMISAYIRYRRIDDAVELFSKMGCKNVISYSAMITGYVSVGMMEEAERLYAVMRQNERDPVASNVLINGYLKAGKLEDAMRVFERMSCRDVVSWSSMLYGFCKEGRIQDACNVFEKMPERNVVSWTSMLCGYLRCEMWSEAFVLFSSMRMEEGVKINSTTLTVICDSCTDLMRFKEVIQIHGLVIRMGFEADIFLGNSIINMYSRVGLTAKADKMFRLMNRKDLVSWNSILGGYVQENNLEKAYELFRKMPKRDVVSWTSMIVGFSKRGRMEESVSLFAEMPEKDDISRTALISGFVNNGLYEEAVLQFVEMLREGLHPNPLTLSSLVSASAGLAVLNQGVQIHALVVKIMLELDLSIQNSLVSMYAKCGNLNEAYQVFSNIGEPNIVSMNSMITGFAQHGFGKEALQLFDEMQFGGCEPNELTFLGVLSACVHVGLVEEGLHYFNMMKPSYHIEPGRDHYVCIVDLLGRAGRLKEATAFISSMPFGSYSAVWGALLSASKSHMDFDLAKFAAHNLLELQPNSATPYVVLSNMYSEVGLHKEEESMRRIQKMGGVRKSPGCSWIVVGSKVHLFVASDLSHFQLKEIHAVLRQITAEMRTIR